MAYLNETGLQRLLVNLRSKLVPQSRTVNGKPLSADVTITAQELGALTELPNASIATVGGVRYGSMATYLAPGIAWLNQGPEKWYQQIEWIGLTASDNVKIYLDNQRFDFEDASTLKVTETEFAKIVGGRTTADTITISAISENRPSVELPVIFEVVSSNG